MTLTVDKEFQSLIPPLSSDEYQQLEANILADGCREPLSLWGDIILDGHNRFRVCQEHGLDFATVQIATVADREQAVSWIVDNQLGRRNLTPMQISYLRGKRYEQEKKHQYSHSGKRVEAVEKSSTASKTADKIADELNVTGRTIRNDAQFTRAVDALADIAGDEFRTSILQHETQKTRQDVKALAQRVADKPKDEAAKIVQQEMSSASQPVRTTIFSHGSVEYYTPPVYVDAARQVMGGIDLDPASCEAAQEWIKATQFFTEADNGLEQDWHGRVWLNPPYSKTGADSNQGLWSRRIADEYKQGRVQEAVLLVKAALGYNWFEELWYEWPTCFARERLSFVRSDGSSDGKSKQGTAFVYFGKKPDKFKEVFSQFGRVIMPEWK